ncbi:MAG: response regulator [Bdellovibrionota bacterium]
MSSNATILIVDDQEALLELSILNLEPRGHKVLTADSVAKALSIISKNKVDLVVTDLRLDDGNGIFLLEEIKNKMTHLDIGVILVTAFSEISKEEVIKKGAIDLLKKPINYDLIDNIAKNLKNHSNSL